MNRFMEAAYSLATYVARNELSGAARDAFDIVDEAASALAAEVRGQEMDIEALEYALCNERMDNSALREEIGDVRAESAKECDHINDRAVAATARADRYECYATIIQDLMVSGVLTPGVLYMVIPRAIADAAKEMRDGKKINAIKIIRAATGANLKECKDWVEAWMGKADEWYAEWMEE